jgi:hypothetical protein
VCGDGLQSRHRTENANQACSSHVHLREDRPCPAMVFSTVTDWSDWGACSSSCGSGVRVRKRAVHAGAEKCKKPLLKEQRFCSLRPCGQETVGRVTTTAAPTHAVRQFRFMLLWHSKGLHIPRGNYLLGP